MLFVISGVVVYILWLQSSFVYNIKYVCNQAVSCISTIVFNVNALLFVRRIRNMSLISLKTRHNGRLLPGRGLKFP